MRTNCHSFIHIWHNVVHMLILSWNEEIKIEKNKKKYVRIHENKK